MTCLNSHERKALKNAALGGEWEHRSKLGGKKTFERLLEREWIKPFSGFNPDGKKFSITDAGREAMNLPPCYRPKSDKRIKTLQPRFKQLKSNIER